MNKRTMKQYLVNLSLERAIHICQAREVTQHRLKSMEANAATNEAECKKTVTNSQTIMHTKRALKGDVNREQQLRTCGNCGEEHQPR